MSFAKSLVFYLPNLAGGGAERVVLALAGAFAGQGRRVELLLGRREGALAGMVPEGVGCHVLGGRTLTSIPLMARYLREHRPSVLVSSLGHNNVAAVLAARIAGVDTKVVICQHSALSAECGKERPLRYRALPTMYRMVLPFAHATVAVSAGVAREMEHMCRRPPGSVYSIPNPAWSAGQKAASEAEPDGTWLEPGGPPVIIGIGRLVPPKDFATLIEAFARVRQRVPARLLIVGEGPERAALETKVAGLDLAGSVHLTGFRANPLALLARAAVVVVSSHYEGFGNVLVEAMGCGTPVVSTDCPYGPAEILEGGRYGKLVPVAAADEIARAILDTLAHPPDPAVLRRRADHFTLDRAVERYAALFDGVARDGRCPRTIRFGKASLV